MRNDPSVENWTYQDQLFSNDINRSILLAGVQYDDMMYREALRVGFYDLQVGVVCVNKWVWSY